MERINQKEEEQIEFVIARFPVHKEKQSFLPYNIYFQSQQHGIQQSVALRLPCIKEGCTTICYFQAQSLNKENKNEACIVCGNSSTSKIYLDIGLKHFISKHHKYIALNTPLNVLINPHTNQYCFSAKTIKNDLESTLSSFIAEQLIKQMKLSQFPLLEQSCLDMYRINKEIKPIFKPPLISKPHYVYSFCKYHPIIQQKCSSNYLVLFIKNIQRPARVKLLTEQGKQICDNSIYLKYAKIVLLGNINTFIFCIPNKYTTEYYVSNCNYHLQLEQKVLVIIHQKSWRDELPRLNGSLIADQINNCVFAIGGFDNRKNDSLDYISCFLNCRWKIENNELFFLAQTQKNHHLFTNGNNKSTMKSSYFKENSCISKFAIVNTSYLINCNPSHRYNNQNKQYVFLSIGGAIKDSIFFGSNKFISKPPGIRSIINDKAWELNPVIHHTFNSQFHFINNNYITIELPNTKTLIQKAQLQQFLVLGDSKGFQKQQKGNLVYLMDHLNLQQPRIISSNFHFGQFLTDNIDQSSALLFDDHSKEYYVRTTIPFAQPIKLETNIYAYCLIIEFDLSSGCIRYKPGVISYFNNQTQIQLQSNELLSKN